MGPVAGLKIVEFAGLGPAPFCAMLLSDLGADVIRVDRMPDASTAAARPGLEPLNRGRRSIAVDLKHPDGVGVVLDLVRDADAVLEGFRPGVMERLGLGPQRCLEVNPGLVFGRVTGWGQDGPYAHTAGHDLNYIALAGVLDTFGLRTTPPVAPLNLIGDFGGGGMLLAVGVLAAIIQAQRSGRGQVIDASMVEGASLLATMIHGLRAADEWVDERGSNFNDSGSHYYNVYETADGRYVTVAAIEPKFYTQLLGLLGLNGEDLPDQNDREQWPAMKERFAAIFRQRTFDEWCETLEGTDVCFAPVLKMAEAPRHPHNAHRGSFTTVEGVVQPAPAPRFSGTPGGIQRPPPRAGEHTDEILTEHGVDAAGIARLRSVGVAG